MKKLSKIISVVLAVAALSALCPAAFAADSPEAHQAEAIDSLIRQEIVLGDEYGNVMESDPITREQMVSVIGRILNFDDSRLSGLEEYFTDAGQVSDWAYSYVLEGLENGIVDGYPDKTFKPQNLMLYEEAIKFTLCAFLKLSDTDPAEYLKAYYTYPDGFIELARENNYLYGTNGTLGDPMSRGDVFTLIYNVSNVTVRGESSEIHGDTLDEEQNTVTPAPEEPVVSPNNEPVITPEPASSPSNDVSNMSISYEEAMEVAERYLSELLSEESESVADDVGLKGEQLPEFHNDKWTYKFQYYSRQLMADGNEGILGNIYVYDDGTVGL